MRKPDFMALDIAVTYEKEEETGGKTGRVIESEKI
jgi:hypothetical protein